MPALATPSTADAVLPLRVRYRQEMNAQIVHDSIHRREGWTLTYMCTVGGVVAGFGSIAIAGPWKDRPTLFEFYVLAYATLSSAPPVHSSARRGRQKGWGRIAP
jgi:hypothetical protein